MQLSGTNFKLADKKYGVIYADPPWYFKNYSKMGRGRNPNQHYKCMSISDIQQLPIADLGVSLIRLLVSLGQKLIKRIWDSSLV